MKTVGNRIFYLHKMNVAFAKQKANSILLPSPTKDLWDSEFGTLLTPPKLFHFASECS